MKRKIKKIKHISLKALHKKAWDLQSKYLRSCNADEYGFIFCFTCGKKDYWQNMDLGHYIHKNCLDFDTVNLKPQCTFCNRFKHGNLGIYAERLIAEYGEQAIAELRVRSQQIRKFTVSELEELIVNYKLNLKLF